MTSTLPPPSATAVSEVPAPPPVPLSHVRRRLVGPDVVRAVALIGVVVMNYHGYLILAGGERSTSTLGRFFDPWTGPLSTRFAATFVLTAGVGTTLLTRSATGDAAKTSARRWTLIRRGLLLYGFGLAFYEIWAGSILPYYGAMFFLAAFMFTFPTWALGAVGAGAALAGAAIQWWAVERTWDGKSVGWLYDPPPGSPRGLVFDVFVNGTHPLLPWLAFFCAGMILGRLLATTWWQPVALVLGVTLFAFATLLADSLTQPDRTPLSQTLASNDPLQRGLLYTASALGTALIAFALVYMVATRFSSTLIVRLLADAGQMTLTLYIAHALVFNFIVDWMGWVRPSGLDLALTFSAIYWVIAIGVGSLWHRRFGIGPAEWLYRKIGG